VVSDRIPLARLRKWGCTAGPNGATTRIRLVEVGILEVLAVRVGEVVDPSGLVSTHWVHIETVE
jgi:hypothetical protein